jgi:hypothetical protein
MASLKRWRQIGQGQFHKWETPGEELEGTWRGMHDGRFGPLGTLETPEGLVTFPLHAALLERLKLVREGADVLVRYTGKQTSKAGRVFKAFEVYTAGDDPLLPPATMVADPPAEWEAANGHDKTGAGSITSRVASCRRSRPY